MFGSSGLTLFLVQANKLENQLDTVNTEFQKLKASNEIGIKNLNEKVLTLQTKLDETTEEYKQCDIELKEAEDEIGTYSFFSPSSQSTPLSSDQGVLETVCFLPLYLCASLGLPCPSLPPFCA